MAELSILPFIASFKSVVIATLREEGHPFSSYAPFVRYNDRFYVFISDIATHAQNLRRDGRAALFFIEDESQSANVFARKRISLQCDAELIPRDAPLFAPVMAAFTQKFGDATVSMLLKMADFNLFGFSTRSGEATFGFGEAYRVGGEKMEQLLPRAGGGHK